MFFNVSFSLFNLVAVSSNSRSACCSLGAPSNVLPTKNENGVGKRFRRKFPISLFSPFFPPNLFDNLITSFMYPSTSRASPSTSSPPTLISDGLSSSHVTRPTRYGFVRTTSFTRNRSCPLHTKKNLSRRYKK